MTTLVLTMIGNDRSGLVDTLSGAVLTHGGSWHHSHMSHLAGKFAGIVVVTVPDNRTDGFLADLEPLKAEGLLDVTAEVAPGESDQVEGTLLSLHLVGHDRPGIVHEVSHALARHRVSIQEMETTTMSAPMSADPLFEVNAVLTAPPELSLDSLRDSLEQLAGELMVDIDLKPESV